MSLAVRGVSVAKGYDPRDFAMVGFGRRGAAARGRDRARAAHPDRDRPALPGALLGARHADGRPAPRLRAHLLRGLDEADFDELAEIVGEMTAEAQAHAARARHGVDAIQLLPRHALRRPGIPDLRPVSASICARRSRRDPRRVRRAPRPALRAPCDRRTGRDRQPAPHRARAAREARAAAACRARAAIAPSEQRQVCFDDARRSTARSIDRDDMPAGRQARRPRDHQGIRLDHRALSGRRDAASPRPAK